LSSGFGSIRLPLASRFLYILTATTSWLDPWTAIRTLRGRACKSTTARMADGRTLLVHLLQSRVRARSPRYATAPPT
jgi:hypothetical protein